METTEATSWETAVLTGGPADGAHMKVTGRPWVIQVTRACAPDDVPDGVRVEAVYVYRRDARVKDRPLRYGFDAASP
ncbi:hypothetical protein D1J63_36415 [Streptomyces sp. KPB2]|uniref:hypothetical protein n=1 Tax=unclassified Streptomyces TaxID=2593676 RepID=UPI000F7012CA|nr:MULTISPECIES: hypothetical protein [unclassified Streptomyces]AZM79820.1 hypothetical protein D1J63_36415 [Streptomyces sp. KPB2]QKW65450.1 hypothetical protein HUT15_35625 [Streptomyces sp. NA03103]